MRAIRNNPVNVRYDDACKMRYPFEIFYSEEDNGYIAIVPDLPGCSAFGETEEVALREVRGAVDSYLKALEADARAIPKPSGIPNASGKITLRMPKSLHARLALESKTEGVSLNQYMLYKLASG